jgi:DNA (cytosine-5)-methyltransferase 1
MENVAQVASEKFIKQIQDWQASLQMCGYTNFAECINAKDYVPQNRDRFYMVSIRDCDAAYYFPKPSAHIKSLNEIYEKDVPQKYYVDYDFPVDELQPMLLGWSRSKDGKDVKRYAVQVANCVTANKHNNTQNYVLEVAQYRMRKMTEREYFRLMGVRDNDIDKIINAVSRTQCNKLAGNSIVVDVLEAIIEQLIFPNKQIYQQLKMF